MAWPTFLTEQVKNIFFLSAVLMTCLRLTYAEKRSNFFCFFYSDYFNKDCKLASYNDLCVTR